MITTNVIYRVFHIKRNDSSGTAFAIDRNGRQYLVTARHVVEGISSSDNIDIYHEQQWKSVAVDVVGTGIDEVDVAVLACPIQLAPPYSLEASTAGMTYGQPVYFLGFPFGWGWDTTPKKMNRNFPMPFVKAGILSAFGEAFSVIYIDGHGNRGFSGGPVVFRPNGQTFGDFQVAGIISHYPTPLLEPIVNAQGCVFADQQNKPIAYIQENPGLVIASGIQHATKFIDVNPIGFELPNDDENSKL